MKYQRTDKKNNKTFQKVQEVSLYLFRLESNSYSKFNLHGDSWLQNCLLYKVYKLKCSNDYSRLLYSTIRYYFIVVSEQPDT